jgi:hypothetical protein
MKQSPSRLPVFMLWWQEAGQRGSVQPRDFRRIIL